MSIVPRGVREITTTITIKSFVFNIGKAEVLVSEEGFVRVNGTLVPLTTYERAFMLALAQGYGQIRTPRMMMTLMWPGSKKPVLKLLDVYASKLRAKLGNAHPDARPGACGGVDMHSASRRKLRSPHQQIFRNMIPIFTGRLLGRSFLSKRRGGEQGHLSLLSRPFA